MKCIATLNLITVLTCFIAAGIAPWSCSAQQQLTTHGVIPGISESLTHETIAALQRSDAWLLSHQQADGHWSNNQFPALTALPLWALIASGNNNQVAINKAVTFILSCVHTNGAIYVEPAEKRKGGGLPNYNTAICMIALHAVGDPDLTPTILKARTFLAKSQLHDDSVFSGGMGYDPETGRSYTDLSNSYIAYEAMKLTEDAEDFRPSGETKADLDWKAATAFLERVQNDSAVNKLTWVTTDPSETGGFVYHPEQTRAGTVTDKNGVIRFRCMPGMTYAGLLSYIYADVDRSDPRVKAAAFWARNHWDLQNACRDPEKINTPKAKEGLYYMYNVMSKGLSAYGTDVFTTDSGHTFNWRQDYIENLLSLQKIDPDTGQGYWINSDSRYWEGDAVLVTSYAVIGLSYALYPVTTP